MHYKLIISRSDVQSIQYPPWYYHRREKESQSTLRFCIYIMRDTNYIVRESVGRSVRLNIGKAKKELLATQHKYTHF